MVLFLSGQAPQTPQTQRLSTQPVEAFPQNSLVGKFNLIGFITFLQIFVYISYILNIPPPPHPLVVSLLSLCHPSAAATWSAHFSITPSTSPPTNTYSLPSLPPAHLRVKCMGFLSQNMWGELIGSSVRLFPLDCFCVAVTCSPPHPHHHLSLTSPSISLLLIHSLVGFLYILIFFLCFFSFPPRLSSLCHDPLKPSAAAEELLRCVSRGGITGAVLADVSTTEVEGRKMKTKNPRSSSLNSCINQHHHTILFYKHHLQHRSTNMILI